MSIGGGGGVYLGGITRGECLGGGGLGGFMIMFIFCPFGCAGGGGGGGMLVSSFSPMP